MNGKAWPQPGDLGFVKTDRNTRSLNRLVIAARDFNGVPIQPPQLVTLFQRTPVIFVGRTWRDIWFTPQGLYVQLIPTAQVSKD